MITLAGGVLDVLPGGRIRELENEIRRLNARVQALEQVGPAPAGLGTRVASVEGKLGANDLQTGANTTEIRTLRSAVNDPRTGLSAVGQALAMEAADRTNADNSFFVPNAILGQKLDARVLVLADGRINSKVPTDINNPNSTIRLALDARIANQFTTFVPGIRSDVLNSVLNNPALINSTRGMNLIRAALITPPRSLKSANENAKILWGTHYTGFSNTFGSIAGRAGAGAPVLKLLDMTDRIRLALTNIQAFSWTTWIANLALAIINPDPVARATQLNNTVGNIGAFRDNVSTALANTITALEMISGVMSTLSSGYNGAGRDFSGHFGNVSGVLSDLSNALTLPGGGTE